MCHVLDMLIEKDRLPQPLQGHPFCYKEAIAAGVTRHHFRKLLKQGLIEQLSRGLYAEAKIDWDDEHQFRSASVRIGNPSAICLLSSLAYYGLTDEIPNKTWIMVSFEKRSQFPDLKLFRTRNPHWDIGVEQHPGFKITSINRTLIECIIHKSKLGSQIGIQSLKIALSQKKTKIRNIAELSRQLGVFHRIKAIIEAIG